MRIACEAMVLERKWPRRPISLLYAFVAVILLHADHVSCESATRIFWADEASGTIYQAKVDGSSITLPVSSSGTVPTGLAMDLSDRKLLFSDTTTGKLYTCNVDGTSLSPIFTMSGLGSIAFDQSNRVIYVTATQRIMKLCAVP